MCLTRCVQDVYVESLTKLRPERFGEVAARDDVARAAFPWVEHGSSTGRARVEGGSRMCWSRPRTSGLGVANAGVGSGLGTAGDGWFNSTEVEPHEKIATMGRPTLGAGIPRRTVCATDRMVARVGRTAARAQRIDVRNPKNLSILWRDECPFPNHTRPTRRPRAHTRTGLPRSPSGNAAPLTSRATSLAPSLGGAWLLRPVSPPWGRLRPTRALAPL